MESRGPFTTHQAVAFGWERMKKNFGFFVVLLLVLGVLYPPLSWRTSFDTATDSSLFSSNLNTSTMAAIISLVILAMIVMVAVQVLKNIALTKIILLITDDKRVEFDDVFGSFSCFVHYVVAIFLYGVIVAVGLALLILPGVIWALRLQFAPYLVVDKQMHGVDALVKSWEMTRGVTVKLLWFNLATAAINVVGAFFLLLGLLASLPTTWVARAHVYRQLLAHHG